MRKLIAGIAIGLVLGVLGTLGVIRIRDARDSDAATQTVELMDLVPVVMERALPGVRVLDVALQTPSTHSVNDDHEVLYDAHITYQHEGRVKRVNLPFGRAKDSFIFPNTTDVVLADDKAEVVEDLVGAGGVQPNNELQRTKEPPSIK